MPGMRWSPAEECYVIVNRRRLRLATIARHLGRSEKALLRWCERNDCWPHTQSWYLTHEAELVTRLPDWRIREMTRRGLIRSRRVPGSHWRLLHPDDVEAMVRAHNPTLWQRWSI